jgi:hypothetical protein
VGLAVGNGVSQLFVYPARIRSSGEFTQAVIYVADVRAAVDEMRGRGVAFEEYDMPETRTEIGVARMPGGGEAAWFKDSEATWSALFRPEESAQKDLDPSSIAPEAVVASVSSLTCDTITTTAPPVGPGGQRHAQSYCLGGPGRFVAWSCSLARDLAFLGG